MQLPKQKCCNDNALLHLALKHNMTIESKYLEKGHTQMECDSMHSIIERYLRQREIHVPADYVKICKNARKCPRPFKVNYLDHTFFLNYSKPILYKSIRPGVKKGDAKVTDIHCLKYSNDGKIYFKLSFTYDFTPLPACEAKSNLSETGTVRKSKRKSNPEQQTSDVTANKNEFPQGTFPNLYDRRLCITEAKYKHLQELKLVIPSDYHSFYDQLLYK